MSYNNIEELFQNSETTKPIQPPSHIWQRIEQRVQHKKVSKRADIYKYVAIAAIGLCLVAVFFNMDTNSKYSSSYFIEDLISYQTLDKSNIDYYAHRKLIDTYTLKFD